MQECLFSGSSPSLSSLTHLNVCLTLLVGEAQFSERKSRLLQGWILNSELNQQKTSEEVAQLGFLFPDFIHTGRPQFDHLTSLLEALEIPGESWRSWGGIWWADHICLEVLVLQAAGFRRGGVAGV